MNDEKYMYFTERIQNTLLKPTIMKMMKETNTGDEEQKKIYEQQIEQKRAMEQQLSHKEIMVIRQKEHEERKKEKLDQLTISQKAEVLNDPEYKED